MMNLSFTFDAVCVQDVLFYSINTASTLRISIYNIIINNNDNDIADNNIDL